MPTILTHAAIPLAIGLGLGEKQISRRLLVAGIVGSMLPDLDVLAFRFNVNYAEQFGHRGASHSLAFALVLAFIALVVSQRLKASRAAAFVFVGVSAMSHGLLDMFTNGGLGVALAWPVSNDRFFAWWQVIEVSPLSFRRLFTDQGLKVFQSELLWVWMPSIVLCTLLLLLRRRRNEIPIDGM